MKKRVIIIGGGVAGMQTALRLAEQGVSPVIIEKEAELGGKLRGWHVLFPSFTPAQEVLTELRRRVNESGIEVMTSTEVAGFTKESVTLADGRTLPCDSVVVASGFTLFDASIKEEYGYGIYDNVFTTADIERMLNEGRVAKADGSRPRRIAFLHCVGSRDEKVCQQHCSKVCCITGVKQAMEMKQLFPEADVFNFYMDIRMFGPGYEEMYREAQQRYNIHFLRGRISEASPTIDGRVQIKAEDTLTGRPLRMSVDMLVLIVGMRANDDNEAFAAGAGLNRAPSGFLAPRDMFLGNVKSNVDGIFYAGTITAPKNIGESLNEGHRRSRRRGQIRGGIAMAAINFGYTISKPRAIDIDRNNLRKSDEILREMPELQTCIGCGACTAVCTAGNLTEFNFRKVHTLVRRGEYQGAYEEMNKCMLCGKCRLVCPRGINTRGVVMLIKRKLGDF